MRSIPIDSERNGGDLPAFRQHGREHFQEQTHSPSGLKHVRQLPTFASLRSLTANLVFQYELHVLTYWFLSLESKESL